MREYGIQLYSLRDISEKDLEGTLAKVAEMGYKTVEFAGFFGNPAEKVKDRLDKYGLRAVGTHTGWELLDKDFDATVAYHKAIGCDNIIVPWAPHKTKAEIDMMCGKFAAWNEALKKEGITLHYHNHDSELRETPEGLIPLEEFYKRTDILFEVDTYWVYVAGKDPCALLDSYGSRVKMIHLKDGFENGEGKSLGQGTAPVAEVLKKAVGTGRAVIVESEGLDPTGAEEVKRCIDYLRDIDSRI